jgi:hypothetical protein
MSPASPSSLDLARRLLVFGLASIAESMNDSRKDQ